MAKHTAPFHFDIVGSFLRPEELKKAREAFNNGNITREELTAVEDRLITDLIQKQKTAGLPVITDGEFRRAYWHLDFMWGFNGVKEIELEHGYKFTGTRLQICRSRNSARFPRPYWQNYGNKTPIR